MAQIPGSARVNQYTATASQTEFIYDFEIYDDDEIIVQQGDDVLTLTTEYTVQDAGEESGGTITLVTGATVGDIITITGNTNIERDTTFTEGGDFTAAAINGEYDRIDNIVKEVVTDLSQSFRLAAYSETISNTIPTPSAGKTLKWNTGGTALENSTYDPDTQVAAATAQAVIASGYADDASDYADAASASATDASSYADNASGYADDASGYATTASGYADDASGYADAAAASAASITLEAVDTDIIPDADGTRDLGSAAKRFAEVHVDDGFVEDDLTVGGDIDVTGDVTAATFNGGALPTNRPVSMYSYVVTSGTAGGSITATTWTTRPINTEDYDEIGITLSSNQLTLPAGTYMHEFFMNYHYCQGTSWLIYDVTNSANLDGGFAMFATSSAGNTSAHSGVFTLLAETVIEVRQYSDRGQATTGLGYAASVAGLTEKHLSIKLTKLA